VVFIYIAIISAITNTIYKGASVRDFSDLTFMVTWYVLSGLLYFSVSVRRLHDVGQSGWLTLIPFYNLYLMSLQGELSKNEYGMPPEKIRYKFNIILLKHVVLICCIGIGVFFLLDVVQIYNSNKTNNKIIEQYNNILGHRFDNLMNLLQFSDVKQASSSSEIDIAGYKYFRKEKLGNYLTERDTDIVYGINASILGFEDEYNFKNSFIGHNSSAIDVVKSFIDAAREKVKYPLYRDDPLYYSIQQFQIFKPITRFGRIDIKHYVAPKAYGDEYKESGMVLFEYKEFDLNTGELLKSEKVFVTNLDTVNYHDNLLEALKDQLYYQIVEYAKSNNNKN